MKGKTKTVKRNNVWKMAYDIRPAVLTWEDEIKLKLRPTVVNLRQLADRAQESDFSLNQISYLKDVGKEKKPSFLPKAVIVLSLFFMAFVLIAGQIQISNQASLAKTEKQSVEKNVATAISSFEKGDFNTSSDILLSTTQKTQVKKPFWQHLTASLAFLGIEQANSEDIGSVADQFKGNLDKMQSLDFSSLGQLTENFKMLKSLLDVDQTGTEGNTLSDLKVMGNVLGYNGVSESLILIQDPNTSKPTGGYIGAYAWVSLDSGKIVSSEIKDVYQLDSKMTKKVVPPLALKGLSSSWLFHDVNWFSDYPASGERMLSFAQSAGLSLRTNNVISLNAKVIKKILELTGPIFLSLEQGSIDSNNFDAFLTNNFYQGKTLSDNKGVFALFLENLVIKLSQTDTGQKTDQDILPFLLASLKNKDIQIYSKDAELQNLLMQNGMANNILPISSNQDYLNVVNTNVGSEKTDALIKQTINLESEIQLDGSIINTLTIFRTNSAKNIKGAINNTQYIRVYLPEGSEILEVKSRSINPYRIAAIAYDKKGFEEDPLLIQGENMAAINTETDSRYYNEFGKFVAANWLITKPTETQILTYKYKLPFTLISSNNLYKLIIQKQSGLDSAVKFYMKIKSGAPWKISNSDYLKDFLLAQDTNISIDLVKVND